MFDEYVMKWCMRVHALHCILYTFNGQHNGEHSISLVCFFCRSFDSSWNGNNLVTKFKVKYRMLTNKSSVFFICQIMCASVCMWVCDWLMSIKIKSCNFLLCTILCCIFQSTNFLLVIYYKSYTQIFNTMFHSTTANY